MSEHSLFLSDALCLIALFLGTAMVFLLVGWRFGRENAGKPMFAFPRVSGDEATEPDEGPDPWAEAMLGREPVFPESADGREPGQALFTR
ncbi:hypothetical protein [Desulfolutivibrio sulfoxidireducens]|uniref:hypothetical protein n=1 Tax=Desulfolutivibrio sulfoxidireducens TaxID=2773299 RepID=UPI00159E5082|nr:hypothetical protein [Desulfolutivibrio sulfoxidireducens]QLA21288.1 hypothetical protein GD604_16940 [Desulfolutivibrio sulfoxidireducens]